MKRLRFKLTAALALASSAALAEQVPTPMEVLGHDMGEDRYVVSYCDTVRSWQRLAASSDRIRLVGSKPR